jgi:hypothetical protein
VASKEASALASTEASALASIASALAFQASVSVAGAVAAVAAAAASDKDKNTDIKGNENPSPFFYQLYCLKQDRWEQHYFNRICGPSFRDCGTPPTIANIIIKAKYPVAQPSSFSLNPFMGIHNCFCG